MSGEVLAAAAAAAAARSLDELLLSHDVIFPALFNSRLSTQFVEKHERLQRSPKAERERESRGAGAGAGHRTPCRGRQKQKPPDGAVALAAGAALPGPQALLPAGWELLPRVPFVARQEAAAAARGAHGQPPRGSIRRGLSCGGRGSEGTRHYGSGRPDAAPSGLRRHRSNLERGGRAARTGPAAQQVPAARSSRAAPARPLRARERAKSAGALARACAAGRPQARYLPAPTRDAAGARSAAGVPGSVGKARGWLLRVLRAPRTLKGTEQLHKKIRTDPDTRDYCHLEIWVNSELGKLQLHLFSTFSTT
ncbi:uncharacterized protein [Taeniopygia guttata]|uniref:uncharacterized protein n=1 Tax=Taeniopygia guttata TaxID=59729 RepID=UPI003BB95B35